MKKIWQWIISFFKKETKTVEQSQENPPLEKPKDKPDSLESETEKNDKDFRVMPTPLYSFKFTEDGAQEIQPNKGFVWNPNNSRGRGKSIWPSKYINKIAWVTYFSNDGFTDIPYRAFPNENGPRARYYGKLLMDIPTSIICRAHIVGNGKAEDVFVRINDTKKRWS